MKKLITLLILSLIFSTEGFAKEYMCVQEKQKDNKISINVKPFFGLMKSYSNIEIDNIPKEISEISDSVSYYKWAEVFFIPKQEIFKTLIFEFSYEGYVTESNLKYDPNVPLVDVPGLITKFKPDRLILKMSERKSPIWDEDMFYKPDKQINFEVCIKKPNFIERLID